MRQALVVMFAIWLSSCAFHGDDDSDGKPDPATCFATLEDAVDDAFNREGCPRIPDWNSAKDGMFFEVESFQNVSGFCPADQQYDPLDIELGLLERQIAKCLLVGPEGPQGPPGPEGPPGPPGDSLEFPLEICVKNRLLIVYDDGKTAVVKNGCVCETEEYPLTYTNSSNNAKTTLMFCIPKKYLND